MKDCDAMAIPATANVDLDAARAREASGLEASGLEGLGLRVETRAVSDIAASEWNALLPGRVEDHAYFCACEAAVPDGFRFSARAVRAGTKIVALAPTFTVDYRAPFAGITLPTALQGIGSPLSDNCPIGIDARLDKTTRTAAVTALLRARLPRRGIRHIDFVVIKDVTDETQTWLGPIAHGCGFSTAPTLPRAVLNLEGTTEAGYLARIKPMRDYIKRALRRAGDIEIEQRVAPGDLADELFALYRQQQSSAAVDSGPFDALSPKLFSAIANHKPHDTLLLVYRIKGELAGFSISLFNAHECIGKYMGFRQPLARQHKLYFVNWMHVVRFCLARGIPRLNAGQNSYKTKVMLGCHLERNWISFRHPDGGWNLLVKAGGKLARFDTLDAELSHLEQTVPDLYRPR